MAGLNLLTPSGGYVNLSPTNTATNVSLNLPAANGSLISANTGSGAFTTSNFNSASTFGFRNRIINGDMRIDQRNAGSAISWGSGDGVYCLDRWRLQRSGSATANVQQVSTAATGFNNSLKVTVTSGVSPSSGNYYTIGQVIEGFNCSDLAWGTSAAKTVMISFWVNSSVTGIYSVSVYNWGGASDAYPATYTINSANTWEYKTITIPGPTTSVGTWYTNNTGSIYLRFDLGSGSDYSTASANTWNTSALFRTNSSVNFMATTGATFYLTGVQFEVGSIATPFDFRSIGQELALCQRYYEKSYNQTVKPGSYNVDGGSCMVLCARNPGTPHYALRYMVSKRTSPTLTTYSYAGNAGYWVNLDTGVESATEVSRPGDTGCTIYGGTANLGQFLQFQYTASSEL